MYSIFILQKQQQQCNVTASVAAAVVTISVAAAVIRDQTESLFVPSSLASGHFDCGNAVGISEDDSSQNVDHVVKASTM